MKVTRELAIECGCCEKRVDEILSQVTIDLPIKDGELSYLLRAISWAAYKTGHRDLGAANLREADLRGADLSAANLSAANLREADLRGANLRGADLSWADLSWANLSEAKVHDMDLRDVFSNEDTVWPEGFIPKGGDSHGSPLG